MQVTVMFVILIQLLKILIVMKYILTVLHQTETATGLLVLILLHLFEVKLSYKAVVLIQYNQQKTLGFLFTS